MEADMEVVKSMLEGSDMVFITAGMGGGTGTGAAPVVAQIAREMGILTVGVVTVPFNFEGPKRMNRGLAGVTELRKACDTVITIPNQKLMSIVDKSTTVVEAFKLADSILHHASKGISDLINVHGLINLDFADVETVMKNMGEAVMGTGTASGEERAVLAAQQAISSPLLDNASISGAQGVLVNITGGADLTLMEVDEATSIIFEEAGKDANIIFGAVIDPALNDSIMVTVIATGFNRKLMGDMINTPPEREEVTPTQTRILAEKENVPLYEKMKQEELIPNQPEIESTKPTLFFDDTNPPIYGNDLEVPAFIRRQHD
jgi:cell division protein FtsZ